MVLSLLVTGGFVLGLYVLVWRPTPPDPTRAVDWQAAATDARTSIEWPVLVPNALPEGWTATSARVEPVGRDGSIEWFMGVVTADRTFISVAQSDARGANRDAWISERTLSGSPAVPPTLIAAGRTWKVYTVASRDERSLVAPQGDTTVVVSGNATPGDVDRFLTSLVAG